MQRNYPEIAYRNIWRQKGSSAGNNLCLFISIAGPVLFIIIVAVGSQPIIENVNNMFNSLRYE